MKAEKFLIINADDLGLHPYINQAIINAHQKGAVTSTTLIASGSAFDEAIQIALHAPNLSVGAHLTLVGGLPPVAAANLIPSLLTSGGVFRDNHITFICDWLQGKINQNEIFIEWSAQIEKIQATGISVSHLDSHQHLHVLPGLSELVLKVAKKYSISAVRIPKEPFSFFATGPLAPMRILARDGLTLCAHKAFNHWHSSLSSPEHFFGMLAGGQMTLERWKKLIPLLPEGSSEVMVHPGANNLELGSSFSWHYQWQEELAALQSEELQEWLTRYSVRLINYRNLKNQNHIAIT